MNKGLLYTVAGLLGLNMFYYLTMQNYAPVAYMGIALIYIIYQIRKN